MKLQLLWNILGIVLALALLTGAGILLLRRLGKRVREGKLVLLSAAVLALYILTGIFAAYLRHPNVSESYAENWENSDFYGDHPTGERVALVTTNQAALEERLRLFHLAEERIILSTFDFIADNSGLDVIAALYEAAERGVQVEIVADGFNALQKIDGESHFQVLAAHPNVEIFIYNPVNLLKPWKLMGRLHDKYIIVDDTYLLLGGRNTNDYFLGNYPSDTYSRDMEVLVYGGGEALTQVESYFRQICALDCTRPYQGANDNSEIREILFQRARSLRETYPQCYTDYDYAAHTHPANRITLLSNPIHTGAKEPWVLWGLTQLMADAEEQVLFHSPYVICNGAMYDSLREIAGNVPDARLVLNSVETAANLFGAVIYSKERDAMLETGFDLYEYYSQEADVSSHMKSALVDNRLCIVGSFNLDMRSAYLDTETVLVIDSKELAADLAAHMARMEASSGHVMEDGVQVPEGIVVPEIPFFRRAVLALLRLIERPFRFLM